MKTIQSYTYPTFMGLCGLLAAISDIIQNETVSNGVIYGLIAIGTLAIVFGRRIFSLNFLSRALGPEYSNISPRPFGFSCIILAFFMWSAVYIAANSPCKDGLISCSVPEVKTFQQAFGIIDGKIDTISIQNAAIKQNTDGLVAASNRWVTTFPQIYYDMSDTAERKRYYTATNINVWIRNETSFNFSEVELIIKDAKSNRVITSQTHPILSRMQEANVNVEAGPLPREVEICTSGKISVRDEWVIERRRLHFIQKDREAVPEYRTLKADEPRFSKSPEHCT